MVKKRTSIDSSVDLEGFRKLLFRQGGEPPKDGDRIEDILASCSPEDLATTDEDRAWMNMKPVGKEII